MQETFAVLGGAGVGLLALLAIAAVRMRRQRRGAEAMVRAAREAELRWRSLAQHTADSIAIVDREGRIEFANRAAAGAQGAPAATLFDGVPAEQQARVRRELRIVFESGLPASFELEVARPDGSRGWCELRLAPIPGADTVQRALAITRDTTGRRESEELLRLNAAQFRALFEGSLDPILIADDEGRFLDASPAAGALFGLPVEQLVGSGIWEFLGRRAEFDALWARFLAEGEARGEWRMSLPGGRTRDVEFSATARFGRGRHLAVLHDVTERRRAEASLRFLAQASRLLSSSLDEKETLHSLARMAVPEMADWCGVELRMEDGTLQRVALAAGDPRREAVGREVVQSLASGGESPLSAVVRAGEPALVAEITEETLAAHARDDEHRELLRGLGLRSAMALPLSARGRTLGAIWFASAESGRTFGPTELALGQELADRAAAAVENGRLYREAQEANRVKDEFLATLSHELRTPLNAIVGWVHLLRAGGLDPATTGRALETIDRNARLQAQLIADILDVSRIVSGKMHVERTPVGLSAAVAAAVEALRPAAAAKEVRLRAEIPEAGLLVLGDATRLQQVAQNLVGNAVKFTPRGGEVVVTLDRSGATVRLVVQDTGMGIAPEFLPHVFDRFRQEDSSTTRPHGGLGLGLAIARHLVEAHGGSLEAASQGLGQGSTFTVRLPALVSGGADASQPPAFDRQQAAQVEDAARLLERDLMSAERGGRGHEPPGGGSERPRH